MGFYVRDLYLDSSRFRRVTLTDLITHDPLTNPPTIPETSPILVVAQLSPQIAEFTGAVKAGGIGQAEVHEFVNRVGAAAVGSYLYPNPDGDGPEIPPWLTPIVRTFSESLHESDLVAVRSTLEQSVRLAGSAVERLQPSEKDVDVVRGELTAALEGLGAGR